VPYKVRKLRRVGQAIVEHGSPVSVGVVSVAKHVAAVNEAVYSVKAEELELSADEITAQLKSRELDSRDLVFEDGRWVSLCDSHAFEHTPRARRDGRTLSRLLPLMYLAIVGAAIGFCLYLYTLMRAPY
jgi:hypothetical protein